MLRQVKSITLVTDVVPVSDPKENPVYNNTASLTCNYDTEAKVKGNSYSRHYN